MTSATTNQESREPPREKDEGGNGEYAEGVELDRQHEGTSASPPGRSVHSADSRRIGPWHPPDYSRQTALANRLSNPALRATRPPPSTSSFSSSRNPNPSPDPYSFPSPYQRLTARPRHHHIPSSSRMTTASSRTSSGLPGSPRSPHRQQSTPRYGSVSPRRQPPLFTTPATSRKVSDQELDEIVQRVTRPTVSSRGGVDLLDKDFTYIPTPRLKTLPVVPGLERRYLGLQKVDSAAMDDIVHRLTRLTSAYKAKFAPNRNVYIDMEPGAHMVAARSAQSAV